MFHFNQPNRARKKCSICTWRTKDKKLLDMCFVQWVETKSVFTFQPIKFLVSTTPKSAKPAVECLVFFQERKANADRIWRWWYMLFCRKDDSRLRIAVSFDDEFSPPIRIYRNRTWTEEGQHHCKFGLNVLSWYWLKNLARLSTVELFYICLAYIQAAWSSQFPTKESSGLVTWVQFLLLWLWKI